MQDRPTSDELLAAIERFLDDEIVPNVPGSRGFHARVAANAIRIVRRELEFEEQSLDAEWAGLDEILGPATRPSSGGEFLIALRGRNEDLCGLIRSGEMPPDQAAAIASHTRRTVRDKLRVTNPELLDRSAGNP
jgi:hypothetical protein